MATKTKITNDGTETIDTAIKSGAEAVKNGFEKAAKGYDKFVEFSKDNAEAVLKSANVAGKGIETFNTEALSFARKSVEGSIAATKAIFGAKSFNEAVLAQTEFSKSIFESYVGEFSRFSDMAMSTAKLAAEPLQARVSAFVEFVQPRAA